MVCDLCHPLCVPLTQKEVQLGWLKPGKINRQLLYANSQKAFPWTCLFLGWPTNPMISPLSKQCQNDILKERLNPAPERENYPNATRAPLAIPPLLTPHCNVEGLQCIINTLQSISDTLQLTTIAPALNLEGEPHFWPRSKLAPNAAHRR